MGSSTPRRSCSCDTTASLGGAPFNESPSCVRLSTTDPTPNGPDKCTSAESPLCRQFKLACQPCVPAATAARPSGRQELKPCKSAARCSQPAAAPTGAGACRVVAHAASTVEHNRINSTRRTQAQFIAGNG